MDSQGLLYENLQCAAFVIVPQFVRKGQLNAVPADKQAALLSLDHVWWASVAHPTTKGTDAHLKTFVIAVLVNLIYALARMIVECICKP